MLAFVCSVLFATIQPIQQKYKMWFFSCQAHSWSHGANHLNKNGVSVVTPLLLAHQTQKPSQHLMELLIGGRLLAAHNALVIWLPKPNIGWCKHVPLGMIKSTAPFQLQMAAQANCWNYIIFGTNAIMLDSGSKGRRNSIARFFDSWPYCSGHWQQLLWNCLGP